MSSYLPKPVEKVIELFGELPGIGPKSAARMAYHFLRSRNMAASKLAEALNELDEKVGECSKCFNVSEAEVCDICADLGRDQKKVCVVEEPLDVVAFEKSAVYGGLYFVLGGVISPAEGISAEELRFVQLKARVNELTAGGEAIEIIIATNPSLEGEATSAYIQDSMKKLLEEGKVTITRLAMGLPTGADLEYADRLTLKRSLEGRREI